jgi:hypothetical protein
MPADISTICYDRHFAFSSLLLITQKPANSLTAKSRENLRHILTSTLWFGNDSRCGHFGLWLESEIFSRFKWALGWVEDDLLGAFVTTWFDVSLDMLTEPHCYCGYCNASTDRHGDHPEFAANCYKARTIEHDEWQRRFKTALKDDPRIALIVARQITKDTRIFLQNPDFVMKCAAILGDMAEQMPSLRPLFLGLAERISALINERAIGLLDRVLSIALLNPVNLLPYFGRFVKNIPPRGNEVHFKEIHTKIDDIVKTNEQLEDVSCVASLRKAQEEIVPYLFGRPKRMRHKSGNSTIQVTIMNPLGPISCSVLDVSAGDNSVLGRGLLLQTTQWRFRNGEYLGRIPWETTFLDHNAFKVQSLTENKEVSYKDPDVEIKWPSGSLKSQSFSIRSFGFEKESGDSGSGLVVFLKESPNSLPDWQKYVLKTLSDVDYGDQEGRY